MARYYVCLPDGRWQVLSTVVDDFITSPMTFDELREYRRERCVSECDRETDSLLTNRPCINHMTYREALGYIDESEKNA